MKIPHVHDEHNEDSKDLGLSFEGYRLGFLC